MTIGGIQAFVSYVTFMMWPIQDLARVYRRDAARDRLGRAHLLAGRRRAGSVADRPDAYRSRARSSGDIEFDHVDFYYEDDKPVLTDFTLKVKPGETIALVGPTGGGKSTIVNLLCRFYEPKEGRIRIGGSDYTEFTLHAIQSRIGMVLQTPHLFSGTIRENIRYGRLDATDEEIEEAAKLAGAHDFIVTLDKGYDEQVGEGGNLLSVGQKQLISLARAVLAQPGDLHHGRSHQLGGHADRGADPAGMESLMEGRTSFVIAHRLSTIKRADRILVIEDGRIAEMGTHAELLRNEDITTACTPSSSATSWNKFTTWIV